MRSNDVFLKLLLSVIALGIWFLVIAINTRSTKAEGTSTKPKVLVKFWYSSGPETEQMERDLNKDEALGYRVKGVTTTVGPNANGFVVVMER